MKYCIDCKWFENSIFVIKSLRFCKHPDSKTECTIIKDEKQFADIERMNEGKCGPDGNNFEPI